MIGHNARGQEIADGEWLISIDLKNISKEDLILVLAAAQGETTDRRLLALPRAELQKRVNAQLAEIAARSGIRAIECNGIARPGTRK